MAPPPRFTIPALAALAAVLRLPAYLADRHLTFDDGVFGASAVAMRDGGVPFRDVFSSQGPLFLPLVWLGDLLGLRTMNAPRILALASGVAITLLVYGIGRRVAGPGVGLLAALATTISGSVLWTSGPLAADGPGLALALGAILVALGYRDGPSTTRAVAFGALIAASFAVKSLFAVPAAVVIGWVLLERRAWRDLGLALAASVAVVLAVSLPWGPGEVWDQAVDYHLDAAGDRTPGKNFNKAVSTLWDRDLLPLAVALAGAGVAVTRWLRRRATPTTAAGTPSPDRRGGPAAPLGAWLVLVVAVLLLEHPLWRPHLTHIVAPAVLLGAYGLRHHLAPAGIALALVAVGHVASNTDILWPRDDYRGTEAAAVADLRALPADAVAVSDEPGFVWRADLRTPHDLVDASILRIDTGRITGPALARAAAEPGVCAVLVWSHRFARFDLDQALETSGYSVAQTYGDDRFLLTRTC